MMPMSEVARAAQREYMRAYRKANPDKIRKKNQRYWQKKAANATKGDRNTMTEKQAIDILNTMTENEKQKLYALLVALKNQNE